MVGAQIKLAGRHQHHRDVVAGNHDFLGKADLRVKLLADDLAARYDRVQAPLAHGQPGRSLMIAGDLFQSILELALGSFPLGELHLAVARLQMLAEPAPASQEQGEPLVVPGYALVRVHERMDMMTFLACVGLERFWAAVVMAPYAGPGDQWPAGGVGASEPALPWPLLGPWHFWQLVSAATCLETPHSNTETT